jgi:hypothetical protein
VDKVKARAHAKKRYASYSEYLPDAQVANRLRMPVAECPPELIELKRQQLAIHRITKQLKKEIKNVE